MDPEHADDAHSSIRWHNTHGVCLLDCTCSSGTFRLESQRIGGEVTCWSLFMCCVPQQRGHVSQYIASIGLSLKFAAHKRGAHNLIKCDKCACTFECSTHLVSPRPHPHPHSTPLSFPLSSLCPIWARSRSFGLVRAGLGLFVLTWAHVGWACTRSFSCGLSSERGQSEF